MTAAIAVIAGRSGERFLLIATNQSATCRQAPHYSDES
jgi:hypothetical protein